MTNTQEPLYSEAFIELAQINQVDEATWLYNGGLAELDEFLILGPPTKRFALVTYDAEDQGYGAEYFDTSKLAAQMVVPTVTGLPGFVVGIWDLVTRRSLKLNINVEVI